MKKEPGPISKRVMTELDKVATVFEKTSAANPPPNHHHMGYALRAEGIRRVLKMIKKGEIDFDSEPVESPQN